MKLFARNECVHEGADGEILGARATEDFLHEEFVAETTGAPQCVL